MSLRNKDFGLFSGGTSGGGGTVKSVGLQMPTAFSVCCSPVTTSGDICVTAAGTAAQYIRGDGQLANFPTSTGGGSSVAYYLNGSISQGTIGGNTYYQMSKTPVFGTGTNFTLTNTTGYIAEFITNAGDPALLNIPAGAWNFGLYFNASNNTGNPSFYVQLYKYNGTTFTLIASSSANAEIITNGTSVDLYNTSLAVPATTLTITDRLAIRVFVNTGGNRTITFHTEDANLAEVITTFSTGVTAINGLTAQVQYFATGNTGTNFAISSAGDTHTFNLPDASATARGALICADWSTFNAKGTVCCVAALTLGTSGTNITSTVATCCTSPVITLNIPDASATARGALTCADWSTFNAKGTVCCVAALTLGTSGTNITSTVATCCTSPVITLNIPDASATARGALTCADWSTFNAKGTVCCVAALTLGTSGTNITSTVATCCTSPVITLNVPNASATTRGALTCADWSTFANSHVINSYQALGSTVKSTSLAVPNVTQIIAVGQSLSAANMTVTAVYVPQAATITGVKFYSVVAGVYTANGNPNSVALYTYSAGTLTLVASSADDVNLWKGTANTWQSKAFSAPYAASAGLYYIGFSYNGAQTTAPTIGGTTATGSNTGVFDFTNSAKISARVATSALPSSIALSGYNVLSVNYGFWLY